MALAASDRVGISQVRFPGKEDLELGVLATIKIERGTILWELNGVMSSDVVDQPAISRVYPHSSQCIFGGPRLMAGPARFCNHSCKPNSMVSTKNVNWIYMLI
jgi:hypothetical protein